jgi:hypothetical protein
MSWILRAAPPVPLHVATCGPYSAWHTSDLGLSHSSGPSWVYEEAMPRASAVNVCGVPESRICSGFGPLKQ